MNLIPVLRQEITFIVAGGLFLCASVIGALMFFPGISQDMEPEQIRSQKSQHVKDPYGYPDKYIEYFEEIEGIHEGYRPYPHGFKIREFQNALLQNAKRGKRSVDLDWVERGPGNVAGRTRAVVIDPEDPLANTWFAATVGGGVWKAQRSDESGQIKWTPLTDDFPSLSATTLDLSRNNPDVMYVGTGEGFGNIGSAGGVGMFKTTDKGENWTHLGATAVEDDPDWRYINRLVVHPDNPDIVVAVTNGGIFRTEDGGQSFGKVYTSEQRNHRVQDLKANPEDFDIQFAAVNGTAILRSVDGGKTWKKSLELFPYTPARIELAISPSSPEVIWASVEGGGSRTVRGNRLEDEEVTDVAELYRSLDGGDSWRFVDRPIDESSAFLAEQGWYDNVIMVHPFSPDTVFIGGVHRWKAWIDSDKTTVLRIEDVNELNNSADFITLQIVTGFESAGGRISTGYQNDDADDDVQDIDLEDMVSVEVRFGPGLTQMAHRYTVPPNSGTNQDGGAGISFPEYIYADYVEVPFQVWDTDNERQLMVSFRDQAADGQWSLISSNTGGPGITHSREYVFISKYDYNASAPKPEFMENGGFRKGIMYFYWPFLTPGFTWNSNDVSPGIIDIDFSRAQMLKESYSIEPWENDDVHVDHHAMIALPIDEAKNEFYIMNGNDGGVAYSRNSGNNWVETDAFRGFNTSQFYDATKRPGVNMYLGGMQDNGTQASYGNANSTRGWRSQLEGDGFDVIWKSEDSLMGASQFNSIRRTVNGVGKGNWSLAGNIRNYEGQFLTSLGWHPRSGNVVFTISPEGGPLRSTNFGGSWHQLVLNWKEIGSNAGKVRVSLADPSVVWAGYRLKSNTVTGSDAGLIHVSENALDANPRSLASNKVKMRPVNEVNSAPAATISGMGTHPFTRATAYVMYSVYCEPKLFRTEDMGRTWEDLSGFAGSKNCQSNNGFPNARVYDIEVFPEIPRIMWVGTDMGIFESRDHGQNWAYLDSGLPAVSVYRIRIVDDQVILATHGRGVWTLDINQVQTSSEQEIAELPESFELEGNYPNPFNPTTNITFKVGNNSNVQITVFDVLGRKVATLTDQPYMRGTHQIQWDASAISSGQYIYRMEANGKIVGVKSMILVK